MIQGNSPCLAILSPWGWALILCPRLSQYPLYLGVPPSPLSSPSAVFFPQLHFFSSHWSGAQSKPPFLAKLLFSLNVFFFVKAIFFLGTWYHSLLFSHVFPTIQGFLELACPIYYKMCPFLLETLRLANSPFLHIRHAGKPHEYWISCVFICSNKGFSTLLLAIVFGARSGNICSDVSSYFIAWLTFRPTKICSLSL